MPVPYLYLLHFAQPYGHARHYLGLTHDLSGRLEEHSHGRGARLLEVVAGAGIGWEVAAIGRGTRLMERRLKLNSHVPRLCPVCRGDDGTAWKRAVRSARKHPAPRRWWVTTEAVAT